jgi:hemerythrin-like metal-binding protein
MPLIQWSSKLSVGVESIDAQHGVLFEALDELHDAMIRGMTKSLTGPLLRNLLARTRDHFSAEEALMLRADYPGLEQHRAQHRELTVKIENYIARFERGDISLNPHLIHFLRDWLSNRIQKEDRAYCPSMLAHGMMQEA